MSRNGVRVDISGMTLEEINEAWPYAEGGGSQWISEARTVLSRAETAQMVFGRGGRLNNPLDKEIYDDLEKVIEILDKYRRVHIPKKLKKENQEVLDNPE